MIFKNIFTGAALIGFLASTTGVKAQYTYSPTPPRPKLQPTASTTGSVGAMPAGAGFNSAPPPQPIVVNSNAGGGGWGGPLIQTPSNGYLTGAASVINSQGGFMVSSQQSKILKEQAKAEQIANKRRAFDEYMYEQANTPNQEELREQARLENLLRSRNSPPATEIWSGKALNDLLKSVQLMEGKRVPGPTVPLDPQNLARINVTSGLSGTGLGVFKNDGKLQWPLGLFDDQYDDARKKIETLSAQALQQAEGGMVDGKTLRNLIKANDQLEAQLKSNIADMPSGDYIKSKRFVTELRDSTKILEDPNVANFVSKKWSAKGQTVGELVYNLTKDGLRFAPATRGDEPAYTALHHSLAMYETGMADQIGSRMTAQNAPGQ